jgi:hypothetical protein
MFLKAKIKFQVKVLNKRYFGRIITGGPKKNRLDSEYPPIDELVRPWCLPKENDRIDPFTGEPYKVSDDPDLPFIPRNNVKSFHNINHKNLFLILVLFLVIKRAWRPSNQGEWEPKAAWKDMGIHPMVCKALEGKFCLKFLFYLFLFFSQKFVHTN